MNLFFNFLPPSPLLEFDLFTFLYEFQVLCAYAGEWRASTKTMLILFLYSKKIKSCPSTTDYKLVKPRSNQIAHSVRQ